ncbi:hypothetical protein D7Y05_13115 [bacterium 1XD42-54]|nr:hypothetical protein D7Y05_13115 [bacterium 1XD42-54]
MITNKYISRIVVILMTVATVICLCAMAFSDQLASATGGVGVVMQYESKLFDTDKILEVNIEIDEDDWQELLDNAISEMYYRCDVVINGTKVSNVGIRPKGNTSLTAIATDPNTDRYSLKIEFDQYVEGQTCFGLDKLILNNNYADATNMKEAIVYDMYRFLDVDASLYNYAKVSVNGEYWGVYLALEAVEDSFLMRNYGTGNGALYKPESMGMGGDRKEEDGGPGRGAMFPGGQMPAMSGMPGVPSGEMAEGMPNKVAGETPEETENEGSNTGTAEHQMPDTDGNMPDFFSNNMPDMGGAFSSRSGGADLNYSNDDLDSYTTIWEGAVTKTGDKEHKKVVKALKHVSEGTELKSYLDIDNILKYMAVHTFVVNQDSLTGNMAHNYYLYESNGCLNILPWDYNLAFGGMGMGGNNGSDVVNHPIDTPFSGTKFFDSLLENETYLAQYHSYLQQLVEEYVSGGIFDEMYQRIGEQIGSLVETDPTAFYSYEEYQTGAAMLYDTVVLRAESIQGQLEGTVPATTEGQRENSSALVDASSINVEVMGTMNMGGMGGKPFEFTGFGEGSETQDNQVSESESESVSESESGKESETESSSGKFRREFPEGFDPSGFGPGASDLGSTSNTAQTANLIMYAVCLLTILGGILFAAFYRRRSKYVK